MYTRIGKLRRDLQDRLGDLERTREQRPRATAQRWAAILPLLRMPTAAVTAGFGSTVIGIAIGAIAAAGVLVGVHVALPHEPEIVAAAAPMRQASARELDPPAAVVEPEATPAVESATIVPAVEPVVVRTKKRERKRSVAPTDPEDGLAAQNELLARAARALDQGRADEALRIAKEHASRFPASPLADLRIALRIEALCATNAAAQARAEAQQFLAQQPGSPVARRISRSRGGPTSG